MNSITKNSSASCQILWFKWALDDASISSGDFDEYKNFDALSSASNFDISDHIDYCSFSKTLNSPAGQFSFRLDNSRDWKDIVKPGQWIMILMSQSDDLNRSVSFTSIEEQRVQVDGSKSFVKTISKLRDGPRQLDDKSKIRCIGCIDRVASSVQIGPNGEPVVKYEVTGRDYGAIYQETEIFYNYFLYEQKVVESLDNQIKLLRNRKIEDLVKFIHNIFLAPRKIPGLGQALEDDNFSLLQIGQQWLLPKPLLKLTEQNVSGPSFYGEITDIFNFKESALQIPIETPVKALTGNIWTQLKNYSVEPFTELYPELSDDGKMKLNMRPIPWAFERKGYPSLNFVESYNDLIKNSSIEIDPIDLIEYNLGEDLHNKFNHYMIKLKTTVFQPDSDIDYYHLNLSKNGKEYPLIVRPSIARHGVRLMHVDINSFAATNSDDLDIDPKNGDPDKVLLLEYNELLVDYYRYASFFESGNVTIHGNNKVRLGKVLRFNNQHRYDPNKNFYIEGYSDEFTIGENGEGFWTQSVVVTRGVEDSALAKIAKIGKREKPQVERADFVRNRK